jgi:hypothetical protein
VFLIKTEPPYTPPDTQRSAGQTSPRNEDFRDTGRKTAVANVLNVHFLLLVPLGQIRMEAFNVTKTPPRGNPNGSFGAPAFGSIASAQDPRVFEAVLKLHF